MAGNYQTGSGSKFYYCTTVNPTASTDSAYAALTWVELVGVETIGEIGDVAQAVSINLLAEDRARKLKGVFDAGDIAVMAVHDPNQASQAAVKGFVRTKFNYAFKILLADGADANDTDTVIYFTGKVMQAKLIPGDNNTPTKRAYNIAIDVEPIEVLGAVVSG